MSSVGLPLRTFLSFLSLLILCAIHGCTAQQTIMQVSQPPALPKDAKQCTVRILEHSFTTPVTGPVVANYNPPSGCGTSGTWAGISLNLTATVQGRQPARLGLASLGGVPVFHTTTPQVFSRDGAVHWTVDTNVAYFMPLFKQAGTFAFDLSNAISTLPSGSQPNGGYDIIFEATFFASSSAHPPAAHADQIVPLTDSASGSSFSVKLPCNVVKIFAEIQLSALAGDELWFLGGPPSKLSSDSLSNDLYREVSVTVDGKLAGFIIPEPVIYPGALVSAAWKPIAPYPAFDPVRYAFDLSMFAYLFGDGKEHNVVLEVASAQTGTQFGRSWHIAGSLHVELDSSPKCTTGSMTRYQILHANPTTSVSGTGQDVKVDISATRSVHFEAKMTSGSGQALKVVFREALDITSTRATHDHATLSLSHQTIGYLRSQHNHEVAVQHNYKYLVGINYASSQGGSKVDAVVDQSYQHELTPASYLERSVITGTQKATGSYDSGTSTSDGTSSNTFVYLDHEGNTYNRNVSASHGKITSDVVSGNLAGSVPG